MKPVFKSLVVASLLATAGFSAFAQAPAPGEHGQHRMDPAKMEAMVAKHNTALKAELKITPEQEGAWTAYTTATNPPAKMDHQRPDRAELAKLTTPERIDKIRALRNQHHKDMQAAMDKRDDATKTFYAALNAEQKKTFDTAHARRGEHHGERKAPADAPKK